MPFRSKIEDFDEYQRLLQFNDLKLSEVKDCKSLDDEQFLLASWLIDINNRTTTITKFRECRDSKLLIKDSEPIWLNDALISFAHIMQIYDAREAYERKNKSNTKVHELLNKMFNIINNGVIALYNRLYDEFNLYLINLQHIRIQLINLTIETDIKLSSKYKGSKTTTNQSQELAYVIGQYVWQALRIGIEKNKDIGIYVFEQDITNNRNLSIQQKKDKISELKECGITKQKEYSNRYRDTILSIIKEQRELFYQFRNLD